MELFWKLENSGGQISIQQCCNFVIREQDEVYSNYCYCNSLSSGIVKDAGISQGKEVRSSTCQF